MKEDQWEVYIDILKAKEVTEEKSSKTSDRARYCRKLDDKFIVDANPAKASRILKMNMRSVDVGLRCLVAVMHN